MDTIKKRMDNIQVAIKVRPFIKREVDDGLQPQWEVKGNSIITKDPDLVKRADYRYSFDHIFNERTTNEQVFNVIVKPIIDAAVNGFNGTVFAYGQTSSGKTYTMMGSDTESGIIHLAVQYMFDAINESKDREFLLRVSYLEIYNEKVKDLLAKSGTEVKIHETQGGIINIKCKEEVINSPENVFFIMKKGEKNRKIGETNMNERSSRGHTIFRITIESRAVDADSDGAIQVSQINLVDLAGSERQRQAGTAGERFKEGTHINLSLTMLGKVIKQLSEGQDFISFRDSKLTRLLQNPLSGNALIAVICAVTPASLEETACSLSFASRVKSIKTKPQVNEVMSDAALLKRYAKQIEKLNTELESLKKGNQLVDVQEMESRLQEKFEANQLLVERIALLKGQFVTGCGTHKEEQPKTFSRRRTWCGSGSLKQNMMKLSSDVALETITEMSPDKPSRKSIIQSVDLMNQTLEDFADFEWDLIESERDRLTTRLSEDGVSEYVSVRKRNARKHVKFDNDICTYEQNYRTCDATPDRENGKHIGESDNGFTYENLEMTPEKKNTSCQTMRHLSSPGTPKEVLRESLTELAHEYKVLQEFTTLEKQTICEDYCKHVQELENLQRHIEKLNFEKDNFERMSTDLHNQLQKVKQESQQTQKNIMQDNEDLLKKLKNLTDTKMSLGEINAQLTQDLDQKIKESEEIKIEASKLNEDLLVKVKDLTSIQTSLEETNSKLMLDLSEKTRRLEELQKDALQKNEDFINQVKELTNVKESLELTNANIVKELQTSEHELSKLRETCSQNDNDLSDKIKQLMDEKLSLEDLNANLRLSLQEKMQKLDEIEEDTLKYKNGLLNEIEKLRESKETTEILNAELVGNLEKEKQRIKELQSKDFQNEDLSKQINELMDIKVSLEELNSKLRIDLEVERQKLEELQRKTAQDEGLAKQTQELMDAKVSLEELTSKLRTDLEEERQKLAEFRNRTAQDEDLSKQIQELMNAKVSLEDLNSKLNMVLQEERQKLEEFQNKTAQDEDLSKQIQELMNAKVSLEDLNSKLNMVLQEERQKLEEFQNKTPQDEDLSKQIQELMNAKVSLEELNSKLKMDLQEERQKLEEFQNKTAQDEDLSKQIQELMNAKVSLEELNSKLNMVLQEERQKLEEFQNKTAQDEDLSKQIQELMNAKVSLEELNSKLKMDLQEERQKLEEFQNKTAQDEDLSKQIQELIDAKVSLEELTSKLRTDLEEERQKFAEFRNRTAQDEDLSKQIQELMNAKVSLEDLNSKLNMDLQEERQKLAEFQNKTAQDENLSKQIQELMDAKVTLEELNTKLRMDLEEERQKLEEFQNKTAQDEDLSKTIQELINPNLPVEELNSKSTTDLQTRNCTSTKEQEQYPAYNELLNKVKALTDDKVSLEEINTKLMVDLQAKIQESEEIQRDICALKTDITQLQKTIHLLTNENLELSTKLSTQLQKTAEARNEFQEKIEELYQRLSTVTNEKITLEDNILLLNEKLNATRPRTPEITNDNIGESISKYEEKIDSLTEENIKLSINITEKEKEINDLKESSSLKYDHHCKYSEEVEKLKIFIEELKSENTELSNDVMEKISDLDVANEQYDILKSKYDMSLKTITDMAVDDMHQLKEKNNKLKNELVDLRSKIRTLSSENENFSKYFSELIEQNESVHNASNLENNTLHLSSLFNDKVVNTNNETTKISDLQNQIDHLKHLNKKLSELKLGRCTQCGYLKELNESYRANKLEVNKLQRKIDIYERQLKDKSAEVEFLSNRTHEDLNLSGYDTSFNTSLLDGMNVTQAEEKLESLLNEFEMIKTDDENLLKIFNDSNSQQGGKLQDNENTSEAAKAIDGTFQTGKPSNNCKVRKEKLEKGINELKDDLQEIRKRYSKYSTQINQFISSEKAQLLDELNVLKSANTKLQEQVLEYELSIQTLNDKPKILEEEVSNLMEQIKELSKKEKNINEKKLYLEVELEDLKTGMGQKDKMINELQQTITQLNEHLSRLEHEIESVKQENKDLLAINEKSGIHLSCLTSEIETVKKQKEVLLKSKEQLELTHKEELLVLEANYKESSKESENKLNKVNEILHKYTDENESLKQEITKLKEVIEISNNKDNAECENKLTSDSEKPKEELNSIKKTIMKEIKSLKPTSDPENLSSKSVDELFRTFFEAIMLKEAEIAEALQAKFNKARQRLEDEKQQSADGTRRMTLWAKELEAENEKLQADLTKQEMLGKEYQEKISQLEHSLKETNNEKLILMEKIVTLETEFNNLQTELEKRPKLDTEQEDMISQQKREKVVHEAVMKKETELQSKFNAEKEEYEMKIRDFVHSIDTCKTKIMEMRNTIEGLEANEKQLKNIIDIKSTEATISHQRLQKVEAQLVQVTNDCSELNRDLEEKNMRITEITALLKTKCDLLSEYKNKVETMTPEYEALMVQAQERKMNIERCKTELENVKIQKQKEIQTLKDQLNSETVKSTSLNKQIIDLTNKNINIVSELNELQSKYEELERVNLKLEKRIRNSTSKVKAEAEIENLKDINKALQSNLEGANNRIAELQDNKKQLLTDLMNLQGQYDCICGENNELKKTLCTYKSKLDDSDLFDLRGKYDNLLQNKNKLALELEEKKLLLNQKVKDHENYVKQINELLEKNKELDEECEDLANEIRKKNTEYAELEEKYFSLIIANQKEQPTTSTSSVNVKQFDDLKRENTELKEEIDSLKNLKKELCAKMKKLENTARSRNNSGSPSNISPSLDTNRRRLSRNDFLDQKRHIENNDNNDELTDGKCEVLRKKIHELELELVSKNGKLATLEMQIQSENFPYQRKCKDLEEKLLAVMNKNAELKNETRRLQRAMRDIGSRECDICRRWQTNKRDQSTQTIPDNVIRFCGTSSGVVEEHVKMQKLEKAHALMKNLCRTRNRRIKELEDKIKELEEKDYSSAAESLQENVDKPNVSKTCIEKKTEHDINFRLAMKENVQYNMLDNMVSSKYTRRVWKDY